MVRDELTMQHLPCGTWLSRNTVDAHLLLCAGVGGRMDGDERARRVAHYTGLAREVAVMAMWATVERMAARMGYDHPGFDWLGPAFKPEHRYLTHEGYPLGTTCWYVMVEHAGRRRTFCADTAPEAVRLAATWVEGGEVDE